MLVTIFPLPTMFSKGFFLRVVKSLDYVVKSLGSSFCACFFVSFAKGCFKNIAAEAEIACSEEFLQLPNIYNVLSIFIYWSPSSAVLKLTELGEQGVADSIPSLANNL